MPTTVDFSKVTLLLAKSSAVVLERIARGAGATRWYFCRDAGGLAAIADELSPGSVVSFYFDERIRKAQFSPAVGAAIEHIIARDGEAVVGKLKDQFRLNVDFPGGSRDLAEFASDILSGESIFFGAFPGRDNDGVAAVTITLPDSDGIVRAHPH